MKNTNTPQPSDENGHGNITLDNVKSKDHDKVYKFYVVQRFDKNEFQVCDEFTDEVIAIFFNHHIAVDYANFLSNNRTKISK